MIKIIAIEREFGCNATKIAETLGARLGWKVFDQTLTEEVARIAKVAEGVVEQRDECLDPWYYRLLKVFQCGSQERAIPQQQVFDSERMIEVVQKVVKDAADAGNCIIVGRGSAFFLRDRPDVMRIFLFAPREFKLNFLKENLRDDVRANELVDSVDRKRRAFVKRYFGTEWPSRFVYHAMLNMALGDEFILATIQNLTNRLNQKDTAT